MGTLGGFLRIGAGSTHLPYQAAAAAASLMMLPRMRQATPFPIPDSRQVPVASLTIQPPASG